ncbi:MAG: formylglycine-generating enzyme family protein [Planctomycetota bacterium]
MSAYNKATGTPMARIPAGPFMMGSDSGSEFEKPVRNVRLDAFELDITPVTNEQFEAFVKQTGYQTEAEKLGSAWGYQNGEYQQIEGCCWRMYAGDQRLDHPVVLVSWNDAIAFADWVGKRLPTEAEWEKAAHGTLPGSTYPWGDSEPDGSQCNFANPPTDVPPTKSVKHFPANGYGLFDLVGNVWQWCSDWYADDSYLTSALSNPTGPKQGTHRVRRGGSWNVIQAFRLRAANRGAFGPSQAAPNVGFRCARSVTN